MLVLKLYKEDNILEIKKEFINHLKLYSRTFFFLLMFLNFNITEQTLFKFVFCLSCLIALSAITFIILIIKKKKNKKIDIRV